MPQVLGVLSIGTAWRFADADARALEEKERNEAGDSLTKSKASGGEVGMPRLVSEHSAVTGSGSVNLSEAEPTI